VRSLRHWNRSGGRQENVGANIYSKKFHEGQDYIAVSNHSYFGYLVVVSAEFWDGQPPGLGRAPRFHPIALFLGVVMTAGREVG
jgi:hypothetical protein